MSWLDDLKKVFGIKEEQPQQQCGSKLVGRFKGIPVIEDVQWFQKNTLKTAAVSFMTNGCGFADLKIVVEPTFSKLSQDCKMFILYHEYGHIARGHLDHNDDSSAKRKEAVSKGKVYYKELEADEFAAQALGYERAIRGLEELYIVSGRNTEVRYRIDNLKTSVKKAS